MNTPNIHFQDLKKSKYTYRGILVLWMLLSIFLGFNYTKYVSSKMPSNSIAKGGTFVETTTEPISYLPYTSQNDSSKFYQHLLYEPCVQTVFSGSNILFENRVCDVITDDNQTYTLSLNPDFVRSDGTNMSLKDIYFTYTSLLKNNYRDLPTLAGFQNIVISIENTNLVVTFPDASVDNIIFFTNFILPEHILANQDYNYYQNIYGSNPIVSTCAQIQSGKNNTQSLIYDLSGCETYPLKFYQVTYTGQGDDDEETTFDSKSIDLAYEALNQNLKNHTYIQNQFETIFFNTNKIENLDMRKYLASYFNTASIPASLDDAGGYIKDQFLFTQIINEEKFSQATFIELLSKQTTEQIAPTNEAEAEIVPTPIPTSIQVASLSTEKNTPSTYWLQTLKTGVEKFKTTLNFDIPYSRVSVTHNNNEAFFLQSYSQQDQQSLYNFNPTFRTIVPGENTYIISAYDAANELAQQWFFSVLYADELPNIQEPETVIAPEAPVTPLVFLYYIDPTTDQIIKNIEQKLLQDDLDGYIQFVGIEDKNVLEGRLSAGEYDIILRTINMGLRRDLSNLFLTSDLTINPSGYVNEVMAELSKDYFLTDDIDERRTIGEKINGLYGETAPLIILGKKKGVYYLDENIENPFPDRVYVRGWRKQYLENLSVFEHISVNRSEVFKLKNVWNYFLEA